MCMLLNCHIGCTQALKMKTHGKVLKIVCYFYYANNYVTSTLYVNQITHGQKKNEKKMILAHVSCYSKTKPKAHRI